MIKINGLPVGFFKFPDGQWHCNIDDFSCTNIPGGLVVEASLTSFDEVIKLLLVANVFHNENWRIRLLKIKYLIGSRMDRVMGPQQPHTLKVIMSILNTISCDSVQIVEPHSDVVEALCNHPFSILGWDEILYEEANTRENKKLKDILSRSIIITPDAGMYKKVERFCQAFNNFNVVEASKKRDLKTGNITATHVNGQHVLAGQECLVIDDLCDGGKTFIELAKVLKSSGAKKLILAVCHGVFSKGLDELLTHYDHIYTTDSYAYVEHPKVTCIEL